jgi:leucyl aminopeptidase
MVARHPDPALAVAPSLAPDAQPAVSAIASGTGSATAVGIPVAKTGAVPDRIGLDRARLAAAGFDGSVGSTLVLASHDGPVAIAFGIGEAGAVDGGALRDAAAAFARAATRHESLAIEMGEPGSVPPEQAAQALVEGVLLARYRFDPLKREPKGSPVRTLVLAAASDTEAVAKGAEAGRIAAGAQMLARDLANTPHSHLNASRFAEFAVALGARKGFAVEVFDKAALTEMGCGGLLGVNRGSVEPPRMIKLTYRPSGTPSGRLALVGKGIMYDSGGLSLKPSDPVHAQMKNDMSGAAVILAAVAALAETGSATGVVAFLMCTDNMPSGTAIALGDVLTMRGGTTVEVMDTDAEGRLVMADALVLAAEETPDGIVDVATLTGSCLRALGPDVAGLVGNEQGLIDQVKMAADATGELVWQLPLHRPYRRMLESGVADMVNCAPVGKPDAIIASLFLSGFAGDTPWAHLDICGTAWNDEDRGWHVTGCSGFGARLLVSLASGFRPAAPKPERASIG